MKPHLRLIALVGLIVPRRVRAEWRQEWEAELRCRELRLADWARLDWRHKVDLVRRSASAFWDALWLQRQRLEDEMFQDLRFGLRMLLKNPGFTCIAVLTLALGIGANTAIFTLLDKMLIQPLPVEQPSYLATFVRDVGGTPSVVSYPKYAELRERGDVLSGLIAYSQTVLSLSDGQQNERVVGQIVSGNYFSVLGVRPALGRFFLPEEDRTAGTHPVVVIGHGLWRRRFGADPAVIGKTVIVNGYRYAVVGVAPSEFTGTTRGTVTEVYVPAMMQAQAMPGAPSKLNNPNSGWLQLIGRLNPRVTREQAQAALAIAAEEPGKLPPGKKDSWGLAKGKNAMMLMDGSRGHVNRVSDLALPLQLLTGVVGFVLLIACANVANLLLARASVRRKEIAVRLALGASRRRIVRQLLTESAILAALGAGAGLLIARWLASALPAFQQQTSFVPRALDGSLDERALGFTLGLSVLTAVVFTLAPARQATRPEALPALKDDRLGFGSIKGRLNVRNLLVVMQVAMSLVVLIGAGLCVKSLRALQAIDPGFEPAKVMTASFNLGMNGYDEARGRQFISDLSERAAALPGVEAVGVATIVAFSDLFWISGARIEGYQPQPGEMMAFNFNAVSPDYFRTLGARLVSGREFTAQDGRSAPKVIIVNEAAARRYWPGQDPIGKRTDRGEVVGLVGDSREKGLTATPRPTIYLPLQQSYTPDLTLHVRTADPQSVLASVRREIQTLDPTLPVYNLRTLSEQRDGSLYTERMAAALLTLFGALALLLATVGVYGVLSYAVTERTREMAIRVTQGAQPLDLVRLVIGQGMRLTLAGSIVGVGAAYVLTRALQRLLFGVSPTDPMTFALIPVLLIAVALAACWIPARRAMRMSPLAALRCE